MGPVAYNKEAEAECFGGMEHFEMCMYLYFSGSNYCWTFFLKFIKNYFAAV